MFKEDFVWGTAASSFQIEGREPGDGAGDCIWDTYCREEGKVFEGHDGRAACDHIHRYEDDFRMMRHLNIKAYRFSVSWARLMPEGRGSVNPKAVAMYRDMLMKMRENGIEPYMTLYHWELPQALEDKGGWRNPGIVEWFGEYVRAVAENFSDLCRYYFTLNEPQCFVGLGYIEGVHAPGLKLPPKEGMIVYKNVLLAHGRAVRILRGFSKQPVKIGIAPNGCVPIPVTEGEADVEAARRQYFSFGEGENAWSGSVSMFSDPIVLGTFPKEGMERFGKNMPEFTEEDMELIHTPIDFLGQNIYNGYSVRADEEGQPGIVKNPPGYARTAIDWPVTPKCLYWGPKFLYERYGLPIYITENGMSCHDWVTPDGKVHDSCRIDFLDSYLGNLNRAVEERIPVAGYFLWSFMDNFEWTRGYDERFGIVYVDFQTQRRIAKDSALWYREVIRTKGKSLSCNAAAQGRNGNRELLFLQPVFKEMIWGGNRLNTVFGYDIPGEDTGECWGISAHPNGNCTVKEGVFAGRTLSELWQQEPQLFGKNKPEGVFPLLTKIIDAKADLSIQVHPDDAYAGEHENGSLGKTECWYILDCPENASLVVGHNAADQKECADMIRQGRWNEFIRQIPVKRGDFIQIVPGTVHAIKGGILLLETQQNSDITYRVYDYDRLSNGRKRELHVEKSIAVITAPAKPAADSVKSFASVEKNRAVLMEECGYYRVWKLAVRTDAQQGADDAGPAAVFTMERDFSGSRYLLASVVEGSGMLGGSFIKKGDHFIIPADYGTMEFTGDMELIVSAEG